MSNLHVHRVQHTYFTKESAITALENIELTIEEGEFVSFLGPSGCGKTTLLSIIAGLLKPTEGVVTINHEDIHTNDSRIGYMLQQDYLFPWKTIKENILLGLKMRKEYTKEKEEIALRLLKDIGLTDVEDLYPRQLSGGMRQRVALVRTLAIDPSILLLDEPFSALDFQTKLKLEELVSKTLMSLRKTAVLVTHDIGEAIAMSTRIFLLSNRPGTVAKTFIVPKELRSLSPFDARQHPAYNELFQSIWKELDHLESKNKN
ncbi:ABC transporter ATP-binding protein [Metabacillus iocasae]|uniref:NitT/TauT family transport system ATP-binding protein n=1 Tax=Priestia iocasae TaxID=2291674 RepID=A0ABS2QZJ2_9BACI|nr:ABC transporter ATP-binding protein [Metabacillus iocasae]MBM7704837.1 NitT/TauT family transport system ATP-binding protein [Metabacillus iocasae]